MHMRPDSHCRHRHTYCCRVREIPLGFGIVHYVKYIDQMCRRVRELSCHMWYLGLVSIVDRLDFGVGTNHRELTHL
jgi:hypothetical protein